MIKINFPEPNDPDWVRWRTQCEQETQEVIQKHNNGEPYKIRSDIYRSDLVKKKFYLNDSSGPPFYRKCAYCESSLANQHGDIEHFRPKKEVHDANGKKIDHPGYYWLGYDWQNLFPSCTRCNSKYNWERPDEPDHKTGKGNIFPIKDESKRVSSPQGDITKEEPLLLHPLVDNPEDFLELETQTGKMLSFNERGQMTIKILGFNEREQLVTDRKETAMLTVKALNDFNNALTEEDNHNLLKYALILLNGLAGKKKHGFVYRKTLKKLNNVTKEYILEVLESRNLMD